MTFRTDVTVDFTASPRIATVAAPSTEITVQDLYDTLATIHARLENADDPILITGSGKQDLGGGRLVGITATLQDCQLAFADRGGPTVVQCAVTDGNLVAVDGVGDPINPISPTTFTQVVIAQSTSAALIPASAADNEAVADAVLSRNAQGGSNGGFTVAQALAAGAFKFGIDGSDVLTVRYDDDSVAFTRQLSREERDAIIDMTQGP